MHYICGVTLTTSKHLSRGNKILFYFKYTFCNYIDTHPKKQYFLLDEICPTFYEYKQTYDTIIIVHSECPTS